MAGTGVHDEPRWLVDDHEVGVLVDDLDLDVGLGNKDVGADDGEGRDEPLARFEHQ